MVYAGLCPQAVWVHLKTIKPNSQHIPKLEKKESSKSPKGYLHYAIFQSSLHELFHTSLNFSNPAIHQLGIL